MSTLSPVIEKFILHWGEMGAKWGVNRTVAQVHALLFISEKPLNAEQVAATLGVARSNVSTSLKELQGWGIVRVVHVMGDRRDHFESVADVWELLRIVLDERKRRECDPTMKVLRECVEELEKDRRTKEGAFVRQRLGAMLDFFEVSSAWYEQMRRMPQSALVKFIRMGGKVNKLIRGAT